MAKYTSFEVYKAAIKFTVKVFELLQRDKFKKEWAFIDQLKRATLSISNIITEGFERETDKELVRFLYFSKGSTGEVRSIIKALKEVKYITSEASNLSKNDILDISNNFQTI